MRVIRSVRRTIDVSARDRYLRASEEMGRAMQVLRAANVVRGFYVMESAESPGTFWEFMEFETREAANQFVARAREHAEWRAAEATLRAIPGVESGDSLWDQRV